MGTMNNDSYLWTVPVDIPGSPSYEIRIIDAMDSSIWGESGFFTIPEKSITVTNPLSPSVWEIGNSYNIKWNWQSVFPLVDIELYRDGVFIRTIALGTDNNGTFPWVLSAELTSSTNYTIKIIDSSDPSVFDFSYVFTIIRNQGEDPFEIPGYNFLFILIAVIAMTGTLIWGLKTKKE